MSDKTIATLSELPSGCVYGRCRVEIVRYVSQEKFFRNGSHDVFVGEGSSPEQAAHIARMKMEQAS